MMSVCEDVLKDGVSAGTINDFYVTRVGDDINLFMTHNKGENNCDVHGLAWEAFQRAAKLAKEMKDCAAGQDILKDAFSGNIRGMGPGAAEMEFVERGSEPVVFFMADKTEPSAYSMPLTRTFMDPFTTTGLIIDPKAHEGFRLDFQDVLKSKKCMMSAPEESYDILSLLGDTSRYAIKRIFSKNKDMGISAVVSTEKLNLCAGKYVGKDDPVCVVRCQSGFPAVGEVLQPYMHPYMVAGWMMINLDSNPTKLIEIVEIGKQLLMTRGALTTFSIPKRSCKIFCDHPGCIYYDLSCLVRTEYSCPAQRDPVSGDLSMR